MREIILHKAGNNTVLYKASPASSGESILSPTPQLRVDRGRGNTCKKRHVFGECVGLLRPRPSQTSAQMAFQGRELCIVDTILCQLHQAVVAEPLGSNLGELGIVVFDGLRGMHWTPIQT